MLAHYLAYYGNMWHGNNILKNSSQGDGNIKKYIFYQGFLQFSAKTRQVSIQISFSNYNKIKHFTWFKLFSYLIISKQAFGILSTWNKFIPIACLLNTLIPTYTYPNHKFKNLIRGFKGDGRARAGMFNSCLRLNLNFY